MYKILKVLGYVIIVQNIGTYVRNFVVQNIIKLKYNGSSNPLVYFRWGEKSRS